MPTMLGVPLTLAGPLSRGAGLSPGISLPGSAVGLFCRRRVLRTSRAACDRVSYSMRGLFIPRSQGPTLYVLSIALLELKALSITATGAGVEHVAVAGSGEIQGGDVTLETEP